MYPSSTISLLAGTSRSTVSHFTRSTGAPRRKPAIRYSSISGGAGTIEAKSHDRIGSDRNGNFHLSRRAVAVCQDASSGTAGHDVDGCRPAIYGIAHPLPRMFRRNFLTLPVHPRRSLIVDLHAVHAEVALAGLRIAGGHTRQGDEPSGVAGPALQDREVEQGEVVALDDFFARAGRHGAREEFSRFCQKRQHLELVEKSLRGLDVHEHADAGARSRRRSSRPSPASCALRSRTG